MKTKSPTRLPPSTGGTETVPLSEIAWIVSYTGYSLEIDSCLSLNRTLWFDDTLLIGARSASIATLRYGDQERTRLMYACLTGNIERVQRLINTGAELNHAIRIPKDYDDDIDSTVGANNNANYGYPYYYPRTVPVSTIIDYTPLFFAVQSGNVVLIDYLLSLPTNTVVTTTNLTTTTILPSSSLRSKTHRSLNVTHITRNGYTILHQAVLQGNILILQRLLRYVSLHYPSLLHFRFTGSSSVSSSPYPATLLHMACQNNQSLRTDIVALLLEYKINPLGTLEDDLLYPASQENHPYDYDRYLYTDNILRLLCDTEYLPKVTKTLSLLLKQSSDIYTQHKDYRSYIRLLKERTECTKLIVDSIVTRSTTIYTTIMDNPSSNHDSTATVDRDGTGTVSIYPPVTLNLPTTVPSPLPRPSKRVYRKIIKLILAMFDFALDNFNRWSVHTEPYRAMNQTVLTVAMKTLETLLATE